MEPTFTQRYSWIFYLLRNSIKSITNKPSYFLAPESVGVFNPGTEAPYVLSIMRVGQ